MIIKILNGDDLYDMLEIENENFRDPWDYKILYQEVVMNKSGTYLGIYVDDLLIAYIGYWNMVDYFDIANLAVRSDYKKQGFASLLLDELYMYALSENVENIFLEVSVNNIEAINLYEKHNFFKVRLIKNYYTALQEDAHLMQKEVKYD